MKTLALVLVLVLCASAAHAAIPQTMSYQGVVRDAVGNVVPDGSYSMAFSIYEVPTGGTALWSETQSLPVENGIVNATLGAVVPLALPFDATYWLGISVEGEAELTPRTELTSAPYAQRAAYADVGADSDWSIDGDNVYRLAGNVGVGTGVPAYKLDLQEDADGFIGMRIRNTHTGSLSRETIVFSDENGDLAGISVYDDDSAYASSMSMYNNRPGGNIRLHTDGMERLRIDSVGNVGVGVTAPAQRLDVGGIVKTEGFEMPGGAADGYVLTSDATGLGSWQPADPLTLPYGGVVSDPGDAFSVTNTGDGTAFRGHVGGTGEAAFFSIGNVASTAAVLHTYTDGTGPALHAHAGGGGHAGVFDGNVYVAGGAVGIGVPNPAAGLEIDGPAKMTGFQLTAAPAAGYVLTSDATGVGTWEPASGTIGGGGTSDYVPKFTGATTLGNSAIRDSSGNVVIGAAAANAKLRVHNTGTQQALRVTSTTPSTLGGVLGVECTGDMAVNEHVLSLWVPDTSSGGSYLSCTRVGESSAATMFRVDLDGTIVSEEGLKILNGGDEAIYVYTYCETTDVEVIKAIYAPGGGSAYDAIGVYGESKPQDFYGIGGEFVGGFTGAIGRVEPTGGSAYYGLSGECVGGSGSNYGVAGEASASWVSIGVEGTANGTGTNYGVHGFASGGTEDWAGYFSGNVRVTGTFTNPGPALEIDHPSDPENKYLRHALVASSEMKTVYDGTVTLDASGEAVVELPHWCEALNTDFRYQLTAIGAPGPSLYIADEVEDNRFRIAGGDPGMKVSWMLTGVRHDAHAEANAVMVEEQKPADERGMYLNPEAHGASPTLAIGRFDESEKLLAKRR